jgi:hypothetical protein
MRALHVGRHLDYNIRNIRRPVRAYPVIFRVTLTLKARVTQRSLFGAAVEGDLLKPPVERN